MSVVNVDAVTDANPQSLTFIVEPSGDTFADGYIARAIGASIFTQADNLPEPRQAIKDAVSCHYGDRQSEAGDYPRSIRLRFATCGEDDEGSVSVVVAASAADDEVIDCGYWPGAELSCE